MTPLFIIINNILFLQLIGEIFLILFFIYWTVSYVLQTKFNTLTRLQIWTRTWAGYILSLLCFLIILLIKDGFVSFEPILLFGASYAVDAYSAAIKATILGLLAFAIRLTNKRFRDRDLSWAYLFITITGIFCFMAISAFDLIFLVVCIEGLGLTLVLLLATTAKTKLTFLTAARYFLWNFFSSVCLWVGSVLCYGIFVNTNYLVLNFTLSHNLVEIDFTTEISFLIFLCGLLFKMGAYPFYHWTISIYTRLTWSFLFILSNIIKIVYFFITCRLILVVFDNTDFFNWQFLIIIVVLGSILTGSLGILHSDTIKMFYAYASLNQIGLALSGLLHTDLVVTLTYTVAYFLYYTVCSIVFFFTINSIENANKDKKITTIESIGEAERIRYNRGNSLELMGLTIVLLCMSGTPPAPVFFIKYSLYNELFSSANYLTVFFLVFTHIFTAIGYLSIIRRLWNNLSDKNNYNKIDELYLDEASRFERSLILFGAAGVFMLPFFWDHFMLVSGYFVTFFFARNFHSTDEIIYFFKNQDLVWWRDYTQETINYLKASGFFNERTGGASSFHNKKHYKRKTMLQRKTSIADVFLRNLSKEEIGYTLKGYTYTRRLNKGSKRSLKRLRYLEVFQHNWANFSFSKKRKPKGNKSFNNIFTKLTRDDISYYAIKKNKKFLNFRSKLIDIFSRSRYVVKQLPFEKVLESIRLNRKAAATANKTGINNKKHNQKKVLKKTKTFAGFEKSLPKTLDERRSDLRRFAKIINRLRLEKVNMAGKIFGSKNQLKRNTFYRFDTFPSFIATLPKNNFGRGINFFNTFSTFKKSSSLGQKPFSEPLFNQKSMHKSLTSNSAYKNTLDYLKISKIFSPLNWSSRSNGLGIRWMTSDKSSHKIDLNNNPEASLFYKSTCYNETNKCVKKYSIDSQRQTLPILGYRWWSDGLNAKLRNHKNYVSPAKFGYSAYKVENNYLTKKNNNPHWYPFMSNLTNTKAPSIWNKNKISNLVKKKNYFVSREIAQTKYVRALFQSYFEANARARFFLSKKSNIFSELCSLRKKYNLHILKQKSLTKTRFETQALTEMRKRFFLGHISKKIALKEAAPMHYFWNKRLLKLYINKQYQGPWLTLPPELRKYLPADNPFSIRLKKNKQQNFIKDFGDSDPKIKLSNSKINDLSFFERAWLLKHNLNPRTYKMSADEKSIVFYLLELMRLSDTRFLSDRELVNFQRSMELRKKHSKAWTLLSGRQYILDFFWFRMEKKRRTERSQLVHRLWKAGKVLRLTGLERLSPTTIFNDEKRKTKFFDRESWSYLKRKPSKLPKYTFFQTHFLKPSKPIEGSFYSPLEAKRYNFLFNFNEVHSERFIRPEYLTSREIKRLFLRSWAEGLQFFSLNNNIFYVFNAPIDPKSNGFGMHLRYGYLLISFIQSLRFAAWFLFITSLISHRDRALWGWLQGETTHAVDYWPISWSALLLTLVIWDVELQILSDHYPKTCWLIVRFIGQLVPFNSHYILYLIFLFFPVILQLIFIKKAKNLISLSRIYGIKVTNTAPRFYLSYFFSFLTVIIISIEGLSFIPLIVILIISMYHYFFYRRLFFLIFGPQTRPFRFSILAHDPVGGALAHDIMPWVQKYPSARYFDDLDRAERTEEEEELTPLYLKDIPVLLRRDHTTIDWNYRTAPREPALEDIDDESALFESTGLEDDVIFLEMLRFVRKKHSRLFQNYALDNKLTFMYKTLDQVNFERVATKTYGWNNTLLKWKLHSKYKDNWWHHYCLFLADFEKSIPSENLVDHMLFRRFLKDELAWYTERFQPSNIHRWMAFRTQASITRFNNSNCAFMHSLEKKILNSGKIEATDLWFLRIYENTSDPTVLSLYKLRRLYQQFDGTRDSGLVIYSTASSDNFDYSLKSAYLDNMWIDNKVYLNAFKDYTITPDTDLNKPPFFLRLKQWLKEKITFSKENIKKE